MMMLLMVIGCSKSDDPTYNISGAVSGATLAGVTMNLTGDATATKTTATDGTYSFTGLPVGNYTVTPVKTGYTFDPLSKGGHLTANQTGQDFVATAAVPGLLPYTISGTVSGAVLAGVQITLTGDATGQTITGASGTYSFPGIALNGNYTVTPSKSGYTFSAISIGVIVSGADSTGNNFTATANVATTYSISGAVTGTTIAGVTITLSGDTFGTAITKTGVGGTYTFAGLLAGDYTVTPSLTGYTFTHDPRSVTLSTAASTGNDFTSTVVPSTFIYTISGTVSGDVTNGVMINLTGTGVTPPATTSGGGVYNFLSLANGVYTVTPVLAGYTFAPSSSVVTVDGVNITGTNFIATANVATTYSISGKVSGTVQSGVTITLAKSGVNSGTTLTNASGNYSFSGLVAGSYTVTPLLTGYTFSLPILSPTISSANVTGQNFVASTTAAAWNQSDLTGTWRMNGLERGKHGDGTAKNKWMRSRVTIAATTGIATCLSYSDSEGGAACPDGFDLTLTMNTTTGVITQSGTNATGAGSHMTMTSTKNFAAGTGTNGESPNFSYQLVIAQKEGTGASYTNADVRNKSFVYHQLRVGSDNEWEYGAGTTDATGAVNISSATMPSGTDTPGAVGTMSLDSNGVVTMSGTDMATYQGFLSDDKKTIVGTQTSSSGTYTNYSLMIIQVTGKTYPAGPLPAGIAVGHMLGVATDVAFWVHNTTTVAAGGSITFSDWVSSNSGVTAPGTTFTGYITSSGAYYLTGNPAYHGQVSDDGKFTVGTQTGGTSPNFVYMLQVNTQ
jgi:inhibitor of cysteine peptidase